MRKGQSKKVCKKSKKNSKGTIFTTDKDLSIPTYITKPENAKYHWIEDGKLEIIMKINAPISGLISVSCFGYILGEIKTIFELYNKYNTVASNGFDYSDILSAFLIGIAIMGFVVTGIYSLIKTYDTHKVLKEIRKREPIDLAGLIDGLVQKNNSKK